MPDCEEVCHPDRCVEARSSQESRTDSFCRAQQIPSVVLADCRVEICHKQSECTVDSSMCLHKEDTLFTSSYLRFVLHKESGPFRKLRCFVQEYLNECLNSKFGSDRGGLARCSATCVTSVETEATRRRFSGQGVRFCGSGSVEIGRPSSRATASELGTLDLVSCYFQLVESVNSQV